tara:strand:- start:1093 stop:1737 length:645 start_codon:yes stop_codon:yes gene_type:complete
VKVAVIDYGVGNLGSVMRSLEELRVTPMLIKNPNDMSSADSFILPGVGNFADCANILEKNGWKESINNQVISQEKPILGICLGMQLLASIGMEGSEGLNPNGTEGLSLIPGCVKSLRELGCNLSVPHVGWNEIKCYSKNESLFDNIPDGTDFYFVHSYVFVPDSNEHIIAVTDYGISVVAAVRKDHIWGTQFHPEKSSKAGFRLLKNFIENPIC